VQHWYLFLAKRRFTQCAEREEHRQSRNALVWPRTEGFRRVVCCKLIQLSMINCMLELEALFVLFRKQIRVVATFNLIGLGDSKCFHFRIWNFASMS
jgi:hypothetical protein